MTQGDVFIYVELTLMYVHIAGVAPARSAWRRKLTSLLSFVFAIKYYNFHPANAVLIHLTTHPLLHTTTYY